METKIAEGDQARSSCTAGRRSSDRLRWVLETERSYEGRDLRGRALCVGSFGRPRPFVLPSSFLRLTSVLEARLRIQSNGEYDMMGGFQQDHILEQKWQSPKTFDYTRQTSHLKFLLKSSAMQSMALGSWQEMFEATQRGEGPGSRRGTALGTEGRRHFDVSRGVTMR